MKNFINPFDLSNKRILITGASSGIGQEIAFSCANMGAELIITGRNSEKINENLEKLKTISSKEHLSIVADLTIQKDINSIGDFLEKESLDGIVHSAGMSQLMPVRMININHINQVNAINFEAPALLTQLLLQKNIFSKNSSIVFISSIAAHIGVPGVSTYSASKAALIALARCLAMEVVKKGIRVNTVSPALVKTPLLDATENMLGGMSEEEKKYPLGFGSPEDVANAVIFLLSSASRWITGSDIICDGGLTINAR